MEADREVLCGPKGRHQVQGPRGVAGARTVRSCSNGRSGCLGCGCAAPRAKCALVTVEWAADTDPLDEHTRPRSPPGCDAAASTLDPVPGEVSEQGTSSVAVSRRFVALSTQRLQAFLDRPLGDLDLRVVCIDGKVFRDHCMVIALGIDADGRKHVLGLRERHRDRGRRQRPAERPRDARAADGPDVAVRHRRRSGAAPGHHGGLRFPRRCSAARCTSAACSAISRSGCASGRGAAGRLGPRRTARRGCWSGWRPRWSASTPAPRPPSGRVSTRR